MEAIAFDKNEINMSKIVLLNTGQLQSLVFPQHHI